MQPKTLRNILIGIIILFLLVIGGFLIWSKVKYPSQSIGTTIKNTFPFGNPTPSQNQGTTTTPDQPPQGTQEEIESPFAEVSKGERLRPITRVPVSGYGTLTQYLTSQVSVIDPKTGVSSFETKSTPISTVRYAVSKNGLLYDAQVDDSSIAQKQLTDTIVPSAEEVLFTNKATNALFRYWNQDQNVIETIVGTVPPDPVVPLYCQASFDRNLARGKTTAKDTAHIKMLIDFLNGETKAGLTNDGTYGRKVEAAVKSYQTDQDISATGVFDEQTRLVATNRCATIQEEVLAAQDTPKTLSIGFLPQNILQLSIVGDTGSVFAITGEDEGTRGILYNETLSKPVRIFTSSFSEWMPDTPSQNAATLTTYASGEVPGYLYKVDLKTGDMVKQYEGTNGLTTKTSPDGKYTIISSAEGKGLQTTLSNLETGDKYDLGYQTLAEKCAWAKDSTWFICSAPRNIDPGTYPDAWYQGKAVFADDFWITYVSPYETKVLYRSSYTHDYIRPMFDENEDYLFVTDRITGTLWVLRVKE